MLKASERFVPSTAVLEARHDDVTFLTSVHTGERHALSPEGEEVWALLRTQRHTVDRLVMRLARRSTGQALAEVPDLVREQLDTLVRRGFVQRVAEA